MLRSLVLRGPFAPILALFLLSGLRCADLDTACVSADPSCEPLGLLGLYTTVAPVPESLYLIRSSAPRVFGRVDLVTGAYNEFSGDFPAGPSSMAVDSNGGYLYYSISSDTSVRRVRLDGTDATVFATDGNGSDIVGLYVDAFRSRLYWWNNAGQMRYVNLSDASGQTLVRTFASLMVVGDYAREEEIWYAGGVTSVRRMPDNASEESLINSAGTVIVDLDLIDSNRLVVADTSGNEVTIMNRDGSGRAPLFASVLPGGQDYASFTNTLYLCDQTNDRVDQLNLSTGERSTLIQLDAGYNPVACALKFTSGL